MQQLSPADLRVLMIEPSAMQRRWITNELTESGIHMIDNATNEHEALDYLARCAPDLVISSLYLPDGTATDLLAKIRANPSQETLPFILISSESKREQLEVFKQSGVIAILPKPFSQDQLLVAITSTIDILSEDELDLELYDVDTLRVLVVDDSKLARKVITRVLGNLGIQHIDQAEDGAQAINLLKERDFDLIVTDYNMPEVNGLELAEHVRDSETHSHIPVLMVTSEANDAHLSHVAQSGVNAITDKPFEPDTVKQLLASILDGR